MPTATSLADSASLRPADVVEMLKTRGQAPSREEPVVAPEVADRIPSHGLEALAEAEPRLAEQQSSFSDPASPDDGGVAR
jgi:hypothetical protein